MHWLSRIFIGLELSKYSFYMFKRQTYVKNKFYWTKKKHYKSGNIGREVEESCSNFSPITQDSNLKVAWPRFALLTKTRKMPHLCSGPIKTFKYVYPRSKTSKIKLFTELAHWADSVIELQCPSVCNIGLWWRIFQKQSVTFFLKIIWMAPPLCT